MQLLLKIAREYGVAPLMMCSTLNVQGMGSYEITHTILNDKNIQENYINSILRILEQSNLAGINFWMSIYFERGLAKLYKSIGRGKITIARGRLYSIYYNCPYHFWIWFQMVRMTQLIFYQIGQIADRVILISYQWTYAYITVGRNKTTIKFLEKYVQYAVTQIPPREKYLLVSQELHMTGSYPM